MTKLQYLLIKLAEEAAEISQIALKTAQFGLNEIKPGQALTNIERVNFEYNDLLAIAEMINTEAEDTYLITNFVEMDAKKLKVEKYYGYSKTLGMVT